MRINEFVKINKYFQKFFDVFIQHSYILNVNYFRYMYKTLFEVLKNLK